MASYSLRFLFQALYFRKVMTTLTMKNNAENHHNQFVSILSNEPKEITILNACMDYSIFNTTIQESVNRSESRQQGHGAIYSSS